MPVAHLIDTLALPRASHSRQRSRIAPKDPHYRPSLVRRSLRGSSVSRDLLFLMSAGLNVLVTVTAVALLLHSGILPYGHSHRAIRNEIARAKVRDPRCVQGHHRVLPSC